MSNILLTPDFKKGFNFGLLCKKMINGQGAGQGAGGGTGSELNMDEFAATFELATTNGYVQETYPVNTFTVTQPGNANYSSMSEDEKLAFKSSVNQSLCDQVWGLMSSCGYSCVGGWGSATERGHYQQYSMAGGSNYAVAPGIWNWTETELAPGMFCDYEGLPYDINSDTHLNFRPEATPTVFLINTDFTKPHTYSISYCNINTDKFKWIVQLPCDSNGCRGLTNSKIYNFHDNIRFSDRWNNPEMFEGMGWPNCTLFTGSHCTVFKGYVMAANLTVDRIYRITSGSMTGTLFIAIDAGWGITLT